jgi:hypothetical protein
VVIGGGSSFSTFLLVALVLRLGDDAEISFSISRTFRFRNFRAMMTSFLRPSSSMLEYLGCCEVKWGDVSRQTLLSQ